VGPGEVLGVREKTNISRSCWDSNPVFSTLRQMLELLQNDVLYWKFGS